MIILMVLGFAAVAAWQAPGLIRRGWWWELAVFSLLLVAAFTLSLLIALEVRLPLMAVVITDLIKMLF